ncbi:MAG: sulfatase-like hydrolase/transferase [Verrucomicrobiales bacterium]|nr:sulfatase-like hydrolase/transferase [Verrucomicrobiales bacterium]
MKSDRLNILWYCTDQQRFDTIGALGNPYVRTPVIDSLVENGVTFTHAYCQSPICTPSRASFMSGMYPSRVHNTRNGNATFPENTPLISKIIADQGYDCGMIGKFHLQSSGKRTEPRIKDDGFRYWKFSHAPRDDWPEGEHDYADWVREKGGDLTALRESPERVPPQFHQTTWATDRAIEFIDEDRGDSPWMLNINVYDPHPPFEPPKVYEDQFSPDDMPGPHFEESDVEQQAKLANADFQPRGDMDAKEAQAKYYAMIAQIDDQFGRLLDHLDKTGQRENTVIIFTSDHGETLGDHGLMFKGCRFYEGLIRVPLIFSFPGYMAGTRCDQLVELLDLSATLLDIVDAPSPVHHQGESLISIIDGSVPPDTKIRDFVRCEYFDALASHFTGGTGAFATMHRSGRYKLSVYHSIGNVGELYDLEQDPWEHNNLWDCPNHQEIKSRLILESFNTHVNLTTDVGSERIAPM